MTDDQFKALCNTYGFAPSRALREMLDKATAPPQRKPLTEEALSKIIDAEIGFNSCVGWEEDFARAVERAHGIT